MNNSTLNLTVFHQETENYFLSLPNEVIEKIVSHCPLEAKVSKQLLECVPSGLWTKLKGWKYLENSPKILGKIKKDD